MTWLVTGGSGFLGRHVLDALGACGHRVVAIGRHHPGGWPVEDFARQDLDDIEGVRRAVSRIDPDVVIHAAGKTPPSPSSLLYRANTRATATLLDALKRTERPCRVVLVGSSAELGAVPDDHLPVGEDHPCRPSDAYGLSKWAATRLGLMAAPPIEVVIGRVFNPVGPGMPASQAFGRFASALANAGPEPIHLTVGNLSARRDFLDVRDVASALIALADRGDAGSLYHIGTGHSRSIREGLDALIRLSGRDVRVEESTASLGRIGPSDSRADVGKIVTCTGWSPHVSWETSLADLWDEAKRREALRRVA